MILQFKKLLIVERERLRENVESINADNVFLHISPDSLEVKGVEEGVNRQVQLKFEPYEPKKLDRGNHIEPMGYSYKVSNNFVAITGEFCGYKAQSFRKGHCGIILDRHRKEIWFYTKPLPEKEKFKDPNESWKGPVLRQVAHCIPIKEEVAFDQASVTINKGVVCLKIPLIHS